ncbi:beta-glucanase (GH16 family) [Paenibacillus anaericanus]|uniref:glycoside hydrolase family 16 protein n=1 Tax=Paenibacillus anaericanus TaxID=170367 RepID=UPI00278AE868|nr:glycoside hydrolase family 16 protein [Paenibacillus anaericanus]MDQ0088829.1 beta-glucanase (GH16 family) [Paenibacillus anaericanus]
MSEWNIRLGNDLLDNNGNPILPGWGNGEQQFYTGHSNNLYIDESGLNLCARRETIEIDGRQFAYTSASLDTKDHLSFCYGKLIVRAKLPVGHGLWPAIWLLPQHQTRGTWPASGEIDIMEAKGRLPHNVFGTLHYGKNWDNKFTDEFSHQFENGTINEFHDYALEWDANTIRWLVDGHCFAERRLQPDNMPFDEPFYLILNLAVGGWYDNVAVDEAALPAIMTISGIWLYQ